MQLMTKPRFAGVVIQFKGVTFVARSSCVLLLLIM